MRRAQWPSRGGRPVRATGREDHHDSGRPFQTKLSKLAAVGEAEAALSRARLRGNQDDVRSTGLRLAQSPLEPSELALAADEAREAARPGALEAAPELARVSFAKTIRDSLAEVRCCRDS